MYIVAGSAKEHLLQLNRAAAASLTRLEQLSSPPRSRSPPVPHAVPTVTTTRFRNGGEVGAGNEAGIPRSISSRGATRQVQMRPEW